LKTKTKFTIAHVNQKNFFLSAVFSQIWKTRKPENVIITKSIEYKEVNAADNKTNCLQLSM